MTTRPPTHHSLFDNSWFPKTRQSFPTPLFAWPRTLRFFPVLQDEITAERALFWHDWGYPDKIAGGAQHTLENFQAWSSRLGVGRWTNNPAPKRGSQGTYWAVEPYDDDDDGHWGRHVEPQRGASAVVTEQEGGWYAETERESDRSWVANDGTWE
jgi:hypothetical protein